MNYTLRSDQKKVKRKVLNVLKDENMVLLGAVTGFGKTIVAWDIIKTYVRNKKRVLVLTHGQKEIRDNFCKSIGALNNFIEIKQSFDCLRASSSRCVVSIPQTIIKYLDKLGVFDIVIIDEAHQFYEGTQVQSILRYLGDKNSNLKQILLTATHYKFKKIKKILISRETALKSNNICNADIKILELPQKIDKKYFTSTRELKASYDLQKKSVHKVLTLILKELNNQLQKSIIVTHNIETADFIYSVLNKKFRGSVNVSHSECDSNSELVENFKHDKKIKLLVVVNRANLGFDCPSLKYVIDLTFSQNISRIEQMFGRVLRKYRNVKKAYIKAYPKDYYELYKLIMAGVMALSLDEVYQTWDGYISRLTIARSTQNANNNKTAKSNKNEKLETIYNFKDYIDIFKDAPKISLQDAIQKLRNLEFQKDFNSHDMCLQKASQYSSLFEWKRESPTSYRVACNNKWQRKIAESLGWEIKFDGAYTFKDCKNYASHYSSITQWQKGHKRSYRIALSNDWVKQIAQDLNWVLRKVYNYNQCKEAAKKFSYVKEWKEKDPYSFTRANNQGWVKKIRQELKWSKKGR